MNPLPKPSVCERIYDAVRQAGHNVEQWQFNELGDQVKNPRANPFYCYRWAFIEPGVSVVLAMWWEDVGGDDQGAFYESNSRLEAIDLVRAVEDWRHTASDRQRASKWAKSARGFDSAVQAAKRGNLPVHAVLVARKDSTKPMGAFERSEAHYRQLDSEPWYVAKYSDESGDYVIRRGPLPPLPAEPSGTSATGQDPELGTQTAESDEHFDGDDQPLVSAAVDQFVGNDRPNYYQRNGKVYERLPEVRDLVLKRAAGKCELESCRAPGFKTAKGAVYLETHHAMPLSLGGADSPANVIALCPSHHREAHHGCRKDEIYAEAMRCISAAELRRKAGPNGTRVGSASSHQLGSAS